ncbi:Uncharacterised protein [Yersinia enterocolitica]|nr:Uncharacterised protein [Yersinia enterocolitica]
MRPATRFKFNAYLSRTTLLALSDAGLRVARRHARRTVLALLRPHTRGG